MLPDCQPYCIADTQYAMLIVLPPIVVTNGYREQTVRAHISKSAVGARGTARPRCGKRGYHIVYKPVFLDHWQPKR